MLGEISDTIGYAGKGWTLTIQLNPFKCREAMVAILWRKEIDNIIRTVTDCGEMIQCIKLTLKNERKILLISAYLP